MSSKFYNPFEDEEHFEKFLIHACIETKTRHYYETFSIFVNHPVGLVVYKFLCGVANYEAYAPGPDIRVWADGAEPVDIDALP